MVESLNKQITINIASFLGQQTIIIDKMIFLLAFHINECILLSAHKEAIFFFESAEAMSFNKEGIITANCISSV